MKKKLFCIMFLFVSALSFACSENGTGNPTTQPDLGVYAFIKIGKNQREVKWNEAIILTPDDANIISNDGKPAFDITYSYRENNGFATFGFKNVILFNTIIVNEQSNLELASKEIKTVTRQIYLEPKNSKLQIKIDVDNVIQESNENNNFNFYVDLKFENFSIKDMPDLTIDDIYNDNGKLSIEISNIGKESVPSNVGNLNIWIDSTLVWTYSLGTLANQSFILPDGKTVVEPQLLSGAHFIRAEIDTQNEIFEFNENNNIFEKVIDFGNENQGAMDLAVSNIYNENGKLSIKITNLGSSDISIGKGNLNIWIDTTLSWTYALSSLSDQSFRNPGGETVIQPQVLIGTHKILAKIDTKNEIPESDENNNSLEQTIDFGVEGKKYPDLVIKDIYDDNNKLSIKIENAGTGKIVDPGAVISIYPAPKLEIPGQLFIFIDSTLSWTYSLATLADQSFNEPGGFAIIQPQVLSGNHIIRASIDPLKEITESNEDNNVLEKDVDFGINVAKLSDLTVTDIYNENGKLAIKIMNIGTADVPVSKGNLFIWIDSTLVWTYSLSTLADQSFRYPNGKTIVQPQYLTGSHSIRVSIDTNDEVPELSEDNNEMEAYINFSDSLEKYPDLSVTNILNDANKLSVKIENIGNSIVPANVGALFIYIDDNLKWTYSLSTLADQSFRTPGGKTIVQPQVLYGQHKIKAEIDPLKVIVESDENNNSMETNLTFDGISNEDPNGTDLGLYGFLKVGKSQKEVKWNESIVLFPADVELLADNKVSFEIIYAYREYKGVSSPAFKNSVLFSNVITSEENVAGLAPMEIKFVTSKVITTIANGKLQVKIDSLNAIKEASETNNGSAVFINFDGSFQSGNTIADNLLLNSKADNLTLNWLVNGNAIVENDKNSNPHFVVRNNGYFYQDVNISNFFNINSYALLIGSVSSERINADGSVTGLPYLYGYMLQSNNSYITAYLQGQKMRCSATTQNTWVLAYGIFKLEPLTASIRFFLNQGSGAGVAQNGSAARFDDLGLYIFKTEAEAINFVNSYKTSR